jgi:transcriptional regulator with XRE-family HTH domain
MDDVRVGRILRALRRRRGWTQKELGRRANVSQQAISLIERGHGGRLAVETVRRVFAALDARWEPIGSLIQSTPGSSARSADAWPMPNGRLPSR